MRRLIVTVFTSLDGVVQAPGGPNEDRSGGFALGGWSVALWDDMMSQASASFMEGGFDLLLGRGTYDIFASHYPFALDDPVAQKFTAATKYVATHRPIPTSWANTVPLEGDVAAAVRALKAGDGPELQVHGCPGLAQTLQEQGLVDEYRIWTFPVLLGRGKRMFEGMAQAASLHLESTRVSTTGVVISDYTLQGAVKTGAFSVAVTVDPDPELRET
jgi:dihydrofolate reductase